MRKIHLPALAGGCVSATSPPPHCCPLATSARQGSGNSSPIDRFAASFCDIEHSWSERSAGCISVESPSIPARLDDGELSSISLAARYFICGRSYSLHWCCSQLEVGCHLELPAKSTSFRSSHSVRWVRTVDGWEDANNWRIDQEFWALGSIRSSSLPKSLFR